MDARFINRLEAGMQCSAAALFAAAVATAAYMLLLQSQGQPQLGLLTAGAGALAFLAAGAILRATGGAHGHSHLPPFQVIEFDFSEPADELLLTDAVEADELLLTEAVTAPTELILTEADRVGAANGTTEPLVLDDIVAELGPDARVVRLFDRSAMPAPGLTPGQLQSRICDHLGDGAPLSTPSTLPEPPDASQALSAALAELRRSLR